MELTCKASIDDSHGRTRLQWTYPSEKPYELAPDSAVTTTASSKQSEHYDLSALDDFPPERAVRIMLRSAAEVEHQLFLQYLYAASSLRDPLAARVVADIAIEEMGHLLTVNNLLIALDGDPYFGRGPDDPTGPTGDPFSFKLRAASRPTLAMFTVAESPGRMALGCWLAGAELRWISKVANTPLGLHPVQRVGALYQKIIVMMAREKSLDATFASATQYLSIQANPQEAWSHGGVSRRMIVETIANRREAINALEKIMTQGEGFLNDALSHFTRFRRLYRGMLLPRTFPFLFTALSIPAKRPKSHLRSFWRALGQFSPQFDPLEPRSQSPLGLPLPRVLHLLAELLNVRYQLLLVRLYEIFSPNSVAARNTRIDSALREMRFVLSPLMDCIRQSVPNNGLCPALYVLPPYFDPRDRRERIVLQTELLSQSSTLLGELRTVMFNSGPLKSVSTAIDDLDTAIQDLPRSGQ